MNTNRVRSILLATLLIAALTVAAGTVSGCGPKDPYVGSWGTYGMLRIERSGDTYLIHDTANPFGNEYEGGYRIRMDEAGQIEVAYEFKYKGPDICAREVGLQWDLPLAFDRLDWDRAADHSFYPADHIGRPQGEAVAHPAVPQTVPPGDRPYALDDHPLGSNDFRSAKRNI